MSFQQFKLSEQLQLALTEHGYHTPTPIQEQAIPPILDGRDVIGCAQTGTGKTAAFALPTLTYLLNNPERSRPRPIRVLVVAPTRELADQIDASFERYGDGTGIYSTAVYGGVGAQRQKQALHRGVEILVACPGRLLDLKNQGALDISQVEVLILDEADRMLDMGFAPDIKRIISAVPKKRQTLLFSATMPTEVRKLASHYLRNPVEISVTPESTTAETVQQTVFFVDKPQKTAVLAALIKSGGVSKAVVFSRTKHGADRLARKLDRANIKCRAIHGDKSQGARTRAIDEFRKGHIQVMVASDIAARGIDINGITHVVNFDLPNEPETYVHRIGRCGRAGASGTAWSLCSDDEKKYLKDIEKATGQKIAVGATPEVQLNAPQIPRSQRPPKPAGQQSGTGKKPGSKSPGQSGRKSQASGKPGAPSSGKSRFKKKSRPQTGDSQSGNNESSFSRPKRRGSSGGKRPGRPPQQG